MKHSPTIALVYDRVNTPHGGAERVLLALHQLYPKAPLYTSLYDSQNAPWASVFDVHTSVLQLIPGIKMLHRQLLALMPWAFSRLDLTGYDIVISITSAEAKAIQVSAKALHICYLLTPPRYLWSHSYEYQTGILKPVKILLTHFLRKWDYRISQQPTVIIPISTLVYQRALKYYRRNIEQPILPTTPFNTTSAAANTDVIKNTTQEYYLIVSRLVSYKRIDIAIEACQKLGKKLIIVGTGPDYNRLKSLITSELIEFITEVTDETLSSLYKQAQALLIPAEEDFGITGLEAQLVGTPIIAYQHVGVLDLCIEQVTVEIFTNQNISGLINAIKKFEQKKWIRQAIIKNADKFTTSAFQEEFADRIKKLWYSHCIIR